MSETVLVMLFVLLLLLILILAHHCSLLSRRIDLVHRRITQNNDRNGLDNGGWDD